MAGGGDSGNLWIKMLVGGGVLVGAAHGLHVAHVGPGWLYAALLAVGGLAVVFGSCEAMIKCVEGVAERAGWNQFVAGAIAGLASNVPEVVMLGFVIVKEPRVGFIVTALTLCPADQRSAHRCGPWVPAPNMLRAITGVTVSSIRSGSMPAASIDGFSILVGRPVKALVVITSSSDEATSICRYPSVAMLSPEAMKRVPI